MKIDDYTPYISAMHIPKNKLHESIPAIVDYKLLKISDIFDLPKGEYLLSFTNPKCSIDKQHTVDFGYGMYSRKDNAIKYYLTDSIINTANNITVDDVGAAILLGANRVKSLLREHTPDFQQYLVDDIDISLKELFSSNGLNHLWPIH